MTTRRIGLLAPMQPELKPLVKKLSLQRRTEGDTKLYDGTVGEVGVVATMTGIGMGPAKKATERLLDSAGVEHVVVVGIAGGIDPALHIGDLVVPEVVIDGRTEHEYRPAPLGDHTPKGTIWSSDDFHTEPEVLDRLRGRGVVALDMETGAVAEVCQQRAVPWSVFRSISDRSEDGIVDEAIFAITSPSGGANLKALAKYLLPKPWRVRKLARLAKDMNVATDAASDAAIEAFREPA